MVPIQFIYIVIVVDYYPHNILGDKITLVYDIGIFQWYYMSLHQKKNIKNIKKNFLIYGTQT